jgi:hypothetical protein
MDAETNTTNRRIKVEKLFSGDQLVGRSHTTRSVAQLFWGLFSIIIGLVSSAVCMYEFYWTDWFDFS